ncbi:MAG: stress response translation initiation inhibitor YciH [archaeon]
MVEVDPITGLPKALGSWETIAKEGQRITVSIVKKKFGKKYTNVSGIQDINLKDLVKSLKSKFACGGTAKDGVIELQGDHLAKVKQYLIELGFPPETISIKEER